MMIPFGILLALVVYLIYTRSTFEKDIVQLYDKKFEEWKEVEKPSNDKKQECKTLVGLVFKESHKVQIELLDESVEERLIRGKFQIHKRG